MHMTKEKLVIWKKIKDGYLISTTGKVYSLKTKCVLKGGKYPNGYLFCHLGHSRKEKRKSFLIHRLVAEIFIPNLDNKPQVDHINGDKTDNRVENLRWVTQSENMLNPITNVKLRNGLKTSENARKVRERSLSLIHERNKKKVYQYDLHGNLIKEYPSIIEASIENGCQSQNICDCCRGRKKTCKGYKWSHYPL